MFAQCLPQPAGTAQDPHPPGLVVGLRGADTFERQFCRADDDLVLVLEVVVQGGAVDPEPFGEPPDAQ